MRELYTKVGRPGVKFYREILDSYLIRNFSHTVKDDKIAFDMCVPEVHAIRGRGLRNPYQVTPRLEIVEVEENVKAPHEELRLFADVFWFIGLPFVRAMSKNIGFRTSALTPSRESPSLKKALTSAFDTLTNNNFNTITLTQ